MLHVAFQFSYQMHLFRCFTESVTAHIYHQGMCLFGRYAEISG